MLRYGITFITFTLAFDTTYPKAGSLGGPPTLTVSVDASTASLSYFENNLA